MSETFTVIVGARQLHDALRHSVVATGDVLTFGDDETLKALETIAVRRPRIVAVERLFAATSRGAALINRIKADPALSGAEIRIVAHDGTYARVSPRRTPSAQPPPAVTPVAAPGVVVEIEPVVEPIVPSQPAANDQFSITRRAPRFRMLDGTEAQVDGSLARIVDLSTIGAQILSPTPLKPDQLVRIVLVDERGAVRFHGAVAWASYEIPKGISQYRAGLEFKGAELKVLDTFCRQHKT
jgi:hypothetical protein